jgi:positive regulator of sigma E activity
MTERGTVRSIRDRLVTIQLDPQDGCEGCSNAGCKASRQSIQAYNRDSVALAEGFLVEVEIQGSAQLAGVFWVLGMPLALLVGGYFAGHSLFPAAGEGPAALAGLAGLIVGMVIGVAVQKGKRVETLPRVLRAWEPDAETAGLTQARRDQAIDNCPQCLDAENGGP